MRRVVWSADGREDVLSSVCRTAVGARLSHVAPVFQDTEPDIQAFAKEPERKLFGTPLEIRATVEVHKRTRLVAAVGKALPEWLQGLATRTATWTERLGGGSRVLRSSTLC